MVVYVDVVFLENLILDFIILLAVSIICNRKIHLFRMFLASFLGGVYTIFCLILKNDFLVLRIIVSIFMILINFGFVNKKIFLKSLGVFYLTAITFAGSAFMFLFSINPKEIIYNCGHFVGLYPVKTAIVGGIFGFFIIVPVIKNLKNKFLKMCDIEIFYNNKSVRTKALVDSRKSFKRRNFRFTSCNC